jgi:superfamily II DNA or RNA helicase
MDKRISGWLKNIYDQWICYEADKNVLQANKVLSVPKYIEKHTGFEFEVDDGLFDRLANKHKDLPDYIIENLADNQSRNNYIVSDYLHNQSEYGKTLIFADRWFQCEYLVEKLNQQGVKAGAVYTATTEQDKNYRGGTGRRNDEMNRQTMQDFRDNKYDVIVNVRMLTEGVDVPDVKTVMITRQTTSNILLTQMIGRALRGEKAGGGTGKDYANVVFFHDTWKRLIIPWAEVNGGLETGRPPKQGRNPLSLISNQLIKLVSADIDYKGFENADYLMFIPVGFYNCEYTIAVEEGSTEELISFEENTIVYEFNKDSYERLIKHLLTQDLTIYAAENITESKLEEKAEELADEFFNVETDDFDSLLISNVAKIIRHTAQNNIQPLFVDFHERDAYDMDKLANELADVSQREIDVTLRNIFNDSSKHWGFFYKSYGNFKDAFDKAMNRIFIGGEEFKIMPNDELADELTDEIRRQVFARDNYTCLCCGKIQRKGISLNADHIRPVSMGGNNAVSNLQTLCKRCNGLKKINEVDYRVNITPLRKPKPRLQFFDWINSDDIPNSIARVVNVFYHCRAMCDLKFHQRRNGRYYYAWEIVLYSGNDPDWLKPYEKELLNYVHTQLGWEHVTKIVIRN